MDSARIVYSRRIRQAVEDAGYVPMSEESMAKLGRELVKRYPGNVKPTSARRYVYRWMDETDTALPGPRWAAILAKVLNVPADSFVIPRSQREQADRLLELEGRVEELERQLRSRERRRDPGAGRSAGSSGRK